MKTIFMKPFAIILSLLAMNNLHASSINIQSMNATAISNEQWQVVSNLWVESFFKTYKDLPLRSIDNDIKEENEDALIDWLKRLFNKYRLMTLQDPYEFTFIYKNERLVAYTLHHVLPQSLIIHIDHFVVGPDLQGQGIGKALLSAVINNHPETESIVLTTRILNTPALGFYKHQGFYETKHIDNVAFDQSYSVLLRKDLK